MTTKIHVTHMYICISLRIQFIPLEFIMLVANMGSRFIKERYCISTQPGKPPVQMLPI